MKKFYILALLFLIHYNSFAQCNNPKTKIVILGDSWAFFSWQGDSYNENLERFGFTDIEAKSNAEISVNGTKASNYFNDNTRKLAVKNFIDTHPELEFVHLSLGGNDLLGNWNKNMTTSEIDAILSTLMFNLKRSIDTIHSFNPNLKILLSGYDFPNFSETVEILSPSWLQEEHPFYDLWHDMGEPTPTEINNMEIKGTNLFIDSTNVWENVFFVNNLGLMQWHYGQDEALQVAPFGTYAQYTAPVPGGFSNYPSPLDALNFDGLDAFHLNDNAYEKFIKRHFDEFYWKQLRNADTTLISVNNSSVNNITIANDLNLGNVNAEQSKIILTFNTNDLLNKDIENASIFIQRNNLVGNNLINEELRLEIRQEYFGSNFNIENEDFDNESHFSEVACTYGTVSKNDFWYRIDLSEDILPFINRNSTVQFRLSFDVSESDRYLSFNTENEKIFLDIKYGEGEYEPIVISVNDVEEKDLIIYPNPVSDFLYLKSEEIIQEFFLKDISGKEYKTYFQENKLDTRNLPQGLYFVSIKTSNNFLNFKFVKQ